MKAKKITKPELEGDTYLIAQAVNHNAELLESALNRIEVLEKGERKIKPAKLKEFRSDDMMNKDAINIMNVITHMLEPQYDTDKVEVAVSMAIKALEQERCDDVISRQAAQTKIKNICDEYGLSYEDGERKVATGGSAYALGHAFDDLPPVTPTRKKGKWITVGRNKVMCSECEITHLIAQYPHGVIDYCPNCGAEMG